MLMRFQFSFIYVLLTLNDDVIMQIFFDAAMNEFHLHIIHVYDNFSYSIISLPLLLTTLSIIFVNYNNI
jgi:hypothetical protein